MGKLRIASTALLVLLAGCGEAPKPVEKKEPEKPPEPVTGRYAFQQMFASARLWAPDVQGLRLRSLPLAGLKPAPGKAGAWEATFVSPSRQRVRMYTYSIREEAGNLHKGVFAGLEEVWTGPRGQEMPWLVAALKVDSDQAYETARKKSEAYIKKNPDKPIHFLLHLTPRHPNLAWRVIWGESVSTSNYSVYVDASTGQYLETMR
jgi:hypothetical protein